MLRTKTKILLTQAHKAADQQTRPREQCDRERHLCAHQSFAEPLLPQTATCSASAFFQSVNEIRARGLQRWINTHQ